MKLKKIGIIMLILMTFNLFSLEAFAKDNKLRVSARNAIAIKRSTGEVLFEKNAYELVPMASTTKILTALVALKSSDLDKQFEVSKKAASIRGSKVGYKPGEKITLRELLYGLMYRSGNDAAITIAEGVSGSVEEFCKLMSHYAFSIGALDSHFMTPHGLDMNDHYSSAYDLAIITSKAMEYDIFRQIVGSKEMKKSVSGFTRDYSNINKILWKIKDANGVKTGYTGGAGKCLVSSIKNNKDDLIIVVLNCQDRWNQTDKIYKYIQKNCSYDIKNENTVNAYKSNNEREMKAFDSYKNSVKYYTLGTIYYNEDKIPNGEVAINAYQYVSKN